ncbi:MAG: type IVB secretion system protein IcmH/DotU [Candidatus Pacearchaeota archaeon]|nr:type IVB secretion system protein IcmH/DotU [Candidatus Pacearchaeota archaeon]
MGASFVDTIAGQTMNLDLTKTLGGAKDLQGLCTDLFLIVIRMREAEDLGEPASLRKLIGYYLDLFEKNCKAIGIQSESIQDAKYALVALIDETVLSVPGICRDYWFTRPLQLDLFGDNIAGEEFYNKLQKMMLEIEAKKDVLEIYYICLSLGFEGKYKLYNAEERVSVMDELGRKLRRTRIRASSGLSPHGSRTDFVRRRKSSSFLFPIWLASVLMAGGVIGLYVWFFLLSTAQVDGIMGFLGKLSFK